MQTHLPLGNSFFFFTRIKSFLIDDMIYQNILATELLKVETWLEMCILKKACSTNLTSPSYTCGGEFANT